ncbi:MAG: ATP-binding protein [Draconibacterium sp.]|nr:ATP-binding protein [Draconibacterium sp.]
MNFSTEYTDKLHKITLNFPDEREREYRDNYFIRSFKTVRIGFIILSFIYGFFGYLDSIMAEDYFNLFIVIRVVVVAVLLFVVFLSYTKNFKHYWQSLIFFAYLLGAIGIIIMLILIPEASVYSSGLMLVFLAGAVLIKLRFLSFSIASWIVIILYIIASSFASNVHYKTIISNSFFFIGATLIGMLAAYANEIFNRQNFNLYLQIAKKNAEIEDVNKNLEEKVHKRTRLLNSRNKELKEEIKSRILIQKELVLAKEKAEESDKLKSAFLANMSHEIRTPMNGIVGFANLLREAEDEAELEEFIEIIIKNGEHLLNLINDIIDLSKIEAGILVIENSWFELNRLTKEIYDMFSVEENVVNKNLKLSYKNGLADDESMVYADRVRLKQIIINLVNNACKYTDEGTIYFYYTLINSTLKFHIIDTGIGIKEEQQESIFDRFMQASTSRTSGRESTGLGLAITKNYLNLMGGSIVVSSKLNVGSEFIFELPIDNKYNPN